MDSQPHERTGGDVLVETVRALGATCVFGMPGQHALGAFDALRRSGLDYIGCRNELNAGFAADDAVAAPRWVVGGLGVDQINEVAYVETTVTADTRQSIHARLPVIDLAANDEATGHAQVVAVTSAGDFAAASDPRSDGRGEVA